MRIVELASGSTEWHKWRGEGIGASEIGIIMGNDPYRTPYQLWEKKCGFAKPEPLSGPMRWGIQNEDKARQWINAQEKLNLEPICVECTENPIFRASLDGWDRHQNVLVEIKCPTTQETIDRARTHSAIHSYWYDQIQWQMMIAKPERAYFAIYDVQVQGCIILQQWPDIKHQKLMREKASEFWDLVVKGKSPELTVRDYKEIDDPALEVLLKEYELADQKCKEGTNQKKQLRDEIYSYGNGDNFKAYGWAVHFQHGKVTYDYQTMEKDGIDLSKYEKRGSPTFTIKKMKEI